MSQPDSVECPECNEQFDPDVAGGWCTNPDCGEYRYEGEPSTTDTEEAENQPKNGTEQVSEESPDEVSDQKSESDETEDDEVACPSCGEQVPDRNFCMNCGEDLTEQTVEPQQAGSAESNDSGETVEQESQPAGDVSADRSDTSAPQNKSDEAESEPQDAPDQQVAGQEQKSEAGSDDSVSDSDGEQAVNEAHEAHDSKSSGYLIIEVGADQIRATDGDKIGSEVRSAYEDTTGDSAEAQYISREHIEIERDEGQFHVRDISTNGTKLNDEILESDEAEPVEDGDTLNFANVTEATIKLE